MTHQIALRPEMGPLILQHLQQFATLPTKGILAGQAVDSAITDLWGKGGGVYNDLDVFRQCPTKAYRPDEKANSTAMRSQLLLQRVPSYGSMNLVLQTTNTYGIASVSRKGMLNHVNCFMAAGRYTQKLTAPQVLAGFDINCVRVGVDLQTGLLHWDRHYAQFLRSRQLKIAMMHTPWHTFLRLAKKARELPGVYANLEYAALTCSVMAHSSYVQSMLKEKDISLLFGQKSIELADTLHSDWAPYFKLELVNFLRKPTPAGSYNGWSQGPTEKQALPALQAVELGKMVALGGVDPAVQARVNKMGNGSLFFASQIVDESLRRKSNQVYVKLDTLVAYRKEQDTQPRDGYVQAHLDLLGTGYIAGQALPAVSDKVETFFNKHTKFWGTMFGMTLDEQATTILHLTQVVNAFSLEYLGRPSQAPWGVLETQATLEDLRSPERARALLVADFNLEREPFKIVPLPLPAMPPQWEQYKLKELLNSGELKAEGAEMGHCVGGYSHSVRSGKSRIVHIRGPGNSKSWSTAEIQLKHSRREGRLVYCIEQHRARFNGAPLNDNEEILTFVINKLNALLLADADLEAMTAMAQPDAFANWAQAVEAANA